MPKIESLYELIKKTSQQKSRPLKIICDGDDCIQPFGPGIAFQNSPDKDNPDKFIDDRSDYILEVHGFFSSDKIYVLPNYEQNKDVQVTNIYHLETGISNLKNELTSQLQNEMQALEIIDNKILPSNK